MNELVLCSAEIHQFVPKLAWGAEAETSLAAIHVFWVAELSPARSRGMKAETTNRLLLSAATATCTWQVGWGPWPSMAEIVCPLALDWIAWAAQIRSRS